MRKKLKTIIKIFGQAIISAFLVFILISAPVRRVLSAVKYTLDSSDVISNITSTGVLTVGSAAVDSFLRLYPTDTVPCAQEGAMYYACSSQVVKFYDGTGWINLAEAAEASGQIAMFDGACPSGWTEVITFQNKFPRGHDADATYCETGGSDTSCQIPLPCHAHTGGAHTHSIPCVGLRSLWCNSTAGTCTLCETFVGDSEGRGWEWRSMPNVTTNACTTDSGGGSAATSACGVTSATIDIVPAFREVVFCKKD